jgi:uncharacterized protein (TIGR02246 family)
MLPAHRHVRRLLFLALSGAVAACSAEAERTRGSADRVSADERAVRSADSALQAAIVAKDAERTAALYAEDAELLPVAEPAVVGREAIRREWAKVFGIPGFANRARVTRVEVAAGGGLAYTRGTYEAALKAPDGTATAERGKWVTVWRRQDGGAWRVVLDIFNTDAPPPDHQDSAHPAGAAPDHR